MDQTFEKRKKVIYDFICDDFYVPMKIKEIAMVLQITKEQRKELQEVLDSLVEEGKISLSKRGKYSKGQTKRIMGTFQANIRGFGFVMVEGQEEDIFIPAENVNGAFQGDEVECIITGSPSGRRQEGKIVGIISHQVTKVVGLYEKSKSFGFVRPDNQRFLKDIYIPAGKELHAMTGHKVVVELTSYGGEHMKPEGKIIEILGHVNDPGTDILSIVKDFDIPTEFPEKVKLLRLYENPDFPLCKLYSTETALEKALKEFVWLKNGGYLIIQPTEALTVIDVNSGKMAVKSKNSAGAMKVNMEAAQEAAKQIRLRNLSGIIIVDFVNLESKEDTGILLKEFRNFLSKDPIPTTLVDMTMLGLVEITRKKVRKPLYEQENYLQAEIEAL